MYKKEKLYISSNIFSLLGRDLIFVKITISLFYPFIQQVLLQALLSICFSLNEPYTQLIL